MTMRSFIACQWLGLAIALVTTSAFAQSPPTRSPNFAGYDCSAVAKAPAGSVVTTQHIGQVIKGKYFEWNEYAIATNGGAPQLACISVIGPRGKALTAAQARTFIADSLAIGALNANAANAARAPANETPERVKTEPRKHRTLPSANAERAMSVATTTGSDLPPVAVTKSSDPNSPENTAPAETAARQGSALSTYEDAPALATGIEDRVQVTNTTTYPWNTIGYLTVTYPNGASYRCTGTLVSPYVVLTAGHCIHNNNRGGFVARVQFFPGQSQNGQSVQRPYGSHADWQNLKTTQRWMQISGSDGYPVTDYQNDFAAVQFKTPFTHTSTFMPVVFSSVATTVTSGGYPAQVNGANFYAPFTDSGSERAAYLRPSHVREFAIDSSGGNSGGPFWATDLSTGRPQLVGSLSYGDDTDDQSGGPYYDAWNQSILSDWISWTPNGVEVAQNSTSGLRMASVFSSAQPESQSFIRLYNPSGAPGTVAVTLADYATGTLLGTWTSPTIPAGASLQYGIAALEAGAGISRPPSFYSLSVRPTFAGYFQHVLWRTGDGSITDLTTCDVKTTEDPMTLMGVHSGILQTGYPSTVVIQNTGTTNAIVTLGIFDARNGARLGTYTSPMLAPNAQDIRSMPAIEAAAGIRPTDGMYHYIIKSDASFTGFLQHLVRNISSGVITDMTPVCQMAPP